jgi:hypothetical protein
VPEEEKGSGKWCKVHIEREGDDHGSSQREKVHQSINSCHVKGIKCNNLIMDGTIEVITQLLVFESTQFCV